jgi:ATP-dependent exoDNAse (exonuclease V) beta subunit
MIPAAGARFDDAAARERIRNSLDESLVVEAAAGTGKTSELVRRIVRVLETGRAGIDKVVAVTFTHKAAGEMKLRLRQELDRARAGAGDDAAIANLEHALEHLEEASIGTIHSFCAQILRQRPVEARVDPAFEELSEQEAARIYERAFRRWLERKLGEGAPGLRRALIRLAWRDAWDTGPPVERLQEAGRKLVEWRDFPAPWRRDPFHRDKDIDLLVDAARGLAEIAAKCKKQWDNLVKALTPARAFCEAVSRAEVERERDYDTLEGLLVKLYRDLNKDKRKGTGFFAEGVPRERVLDLREKLLAALEEFKKRSDADLAAALRQEMQDLLEIYAEMKARSGKLDFVDLLLEARELIRGNAEVRRYFQKRFTHIFVDEFQDTDPVQVEILLLLAADDPGESDWRKATPLPGKLFAVGDPKQSIYKFRRADVVLYQAVRDALAARGVGVAHLTKSFRAVRPLQECVNAAFEPEMTGDADSGQAGYVPLEEHAGPIDGQPCVIALPAPRPYSDRRVVKWAIDRCLPETIVAFVEWLLNESGWKVREAGDGERLVKIESRHVAILFRRFTNAGVDLTRDYARSLEARGIPHLLVGGKSYHKREEVETLRAALAAVEWPGDELSVFATLKGSLFAIPDRTLLRFRHEIGKLHPFRPLPEDLAEEFRPVAEALGLLAGLHRGRNRRPVAETVNLLLEATRAHAGFAMRPAGHQVVANVNRLVDLARSSEATGGISFRGFVEELEAQAEKEEAPEAPVLEEGAEGVRLMTVHSAKGLEFPVVILADMTANIAQRAPDRYVDADRRLCATRLLHCAPKELLEQEAREKAREIAEGMRVAYVAATRARDLLVVPVVGDEEVPDTWVSPLNKALYPAKDRRRRPEPAPGCPPFGEASVLERPISGPEISVKPGLHRPRRGLHSVVWWDPAALRLGVDGNFGLRQQDVLQEGGGASLERYQRWKARRQSVLEAGCKPTFTPFAASEAAEAPADFSCEVRLVTVAKQPGRPAGPRFGTLVHALLREAGDIGLAARRLGRTLGASEDETAAAAEAVRAASAHPLLERARRASQLHREYPVMWKLPDGKILEGVIDLVFLENGTWTVVDFKTDADLPAHRARYERQLQWYTLAMARLTGMPVQAVLLSV